MRYIYLFFLISYQAYGKEIVFTDSLDILFHYNLKRNYITSQNIESKKNLPKSGLFNYLMKKENLYITSSIAKSYINLESLIPEQDKEKILQPKFIPRIGKIFPEQLENYIAQSPIIKEYLINKTIQEENPSSVIIYTTSHEYGVDLYHRIIHTNPNIIFKVFLRDLSGRFALRFYKSKYISSRINHEIFIFDEELSRSFKSNSILHKHILTNTQKLLFYKWRDENNKEIPLVNLKEPALEIINNYLSSKETPLLQINPSE